MMEWSEKKWNEKEKNKKWLSWKPERAAQSEKEILIWNELKPEVVDLSWNRRFERRSWEVS